MNERHTDRLVLRPCADGDVEPLHRLWTEPDVRRFLWDDEEIPLEQAAAVVRQSHQDWRGRGYGLWTVRTADEGGLIGFCGFRPAEWRDAPELLFGLSRRTWGQGYATEAASAALDHLSGTLDLAEVVAATDVGNTASVRVLERLGMQLKRRGTLHGLDTLFYEKRLVASEAEAK